jgi:sortase A
MFVGFPPPAPALVAPAHVIRAGADLGSVYIPKLAEHTPFFEGTSAGVLARGAGHYRQTSLPSEMGGTVAIAAHRVTPVGSRPYGPFRYLDRLRQGDRIVVRFRGRRYIYGVYGRRVVKPTAGWVLMRTRRFPRLVLTTCTPPHTATFRLVVFARLVRSEGAGR